MTIYPAIDLRNGKCVRLFQGKAEAETIYFDDPLIPAKKWKEQGASYLHVVDLDGAFSGDSQNLSVVSDIVSTTGLQVQLGGGIRDEMSIRQALDSGLNRVIAGTRACEDPEWVGKMISLFGADKIIVGIDSKDGMVATKGWVEKTDVPSTDLAKKLVKLGVQWIIHTDVATDGAMLGPNLEAQADMAKAVPSCKIIASGGVSKNQDIDDLLDLAKKYPNIEGVIIGKSLYEGTVDLVKYLV
ncbi:MAG: 1-(5-phosphoribosyl)-5-[(5-phosphoribosylamino)methylideneamino]imidazole-4-carboxamide isomerase [Opitutales bacterium]|nr:1-(5-phosphoribosyl)-5-[(5-phosphoribosylamino)methylideneamino]imidazole-4-carboxamide isomerase [Opitutales bacterium]